VGRHDGAKTGTPESQAEIDGCIVPSQSTVQAADPLEDQPTSRQARRGDSCAISNVKDVREMSACPRRLGAERMQQPAITPDDDSCRIDRPVRAQYDRSDGANLRLLRELEQRFDPIRRNRLDGRGQKNYVIAFHFSDGTFQLSAAEVCAGIDEFDVCVSSLPSQAVQASVFLGVHTTSH
jgi:hypothetical protein